MVWPSAAAKSAAGETSSVSTRTAIDDSVLTRPADDHGRGRCRVGSARTAASSRSRPASSLMPTRLSTRRSTSPVRVPASMVNRPGSRWRTTLTPAAARTARRAGGSGCGQDPHQRLRGADGVVELMGMDHPGGDRRDQVVVARHGEHGVGHRGRHPAGAPPLRAGGARAAAAGRRRRRARSAPVPTAERCPGRADRSGRRARPRRTDHHRARVRRTRARSAR